MFLGVAIMAIATFVFPFLALFLRSRGCSVEQAGLLVSLFGAGSLLGFPVAGWAADRFGRRPALLAALGSAGVLTALLAVPGPLVLVAVLTLALGLAVHAYWPVANAVVTDVLPPDRYEDAFGLMYWMRNAGIALSFALGGWLSSLGFGLLFGLDAATTLAACCLLWFKLPRAEARPPAAPVKNQAGWGAVLADKPMRRLLLLNTVFAVCLFQHMVALPLAMTARGLGATDYGLSMAVNGVLIILLQPWTTSLTRTRRPAAVLALAALLVAVGQGLYAVCATLPQYAAATGVWSLGEILAVPVLSAWTGRLAPAHLSGRYQGAMGFSFGLGLTLAPVVGPVVLGRFGGQTLWMGCGVVGTGVALAYLALFRDRPE
ncbi:MAG: MFS transporter [Polyangia bacterium]